MRTAVSLKALPAIIVLAVLAYLPYVPIEVPGLLRRPMGRAASSCSRPASSSPASPSATTSSSAGPGLLSFGHALFVAAGSYLLTISLSDWALPLPVAVLVSLSRRCSRSSSAASHCGSVASPSPW